MIRFSVILLLTALVLVAACSQGYIVNMNAETKYPEGRSLFVSKCNACHQLYSPYRFSETAWDSILVPMQDKAKLDQEQRAAIYNWIKEIKKRPPDTLRVLQ